MKKYKIYVHPCSTSVLWYIIPIEFADDFEKDEKFKIGFYGSPFKEYLNKKYDNNRPYIEILGIEELLLPKWAEESYYRYQLPNTKYYYEFSSSFGQNDGIEKIIPKKRMKQLKNQLKKKYIA